MSTLNQIFDIVKNVIEGIGLNPFIAIINIVGAIIVIVQAIKKPKAKFFAVVGLICSITSIATAEYTTLSIILLIILGIIIFLISSIQVYSDFEKHVVQASILFSEVSKNGGTSKEKLTKLLKEVRKNVKVLKRTELAKGLELISRKGVSHLEAKELLIVSSNISSGLSDSFILSIELLIKLKRYFKIEDYTSIGDRLCKTASYGVQLEEVNQAFDSFNENCYYSDYLSFSEFLATLSVLGQSELRGEKAGLGLADMVNGISQIGYTKSFDDFLEETIDSLVNENRG